MSDFLVGIIVGSIGGFYACIVAQITCRTAGAWAGRRAADRWVRDRKKYEEFMHVTTGIDNVAFGAAPYTDVPTRHVPDGYEGLVYPQAKETKP